MEKELEIFIKNIKKDTGAEIFVYNGEKELGDKKVFIDEALNETVFRVSIGGKDRLLTIRGTKNEQKTCAALICKLAKAVLSKGVKNDRGEFLRSLLSGGLDPVELEFGLNKYAVKFSCGTVLKIVCKPEKTDEINEFLCDYVGEGEVVIPVDKGEFAIIKPLNKEGEERNVSTLYAKVLHQTVFEETGEKIIVGLGSEINSPLSIAESFAQASAAIRLLKELKEEGDVVAFRDFVFYKIMEEQQRVKAIEYLSLIMSDDALKVFSDEELVETAEEFMRRDLNLSETARRLYLHRNTLTYRLDKIERITGLDIRKFKDALTFKTAKTLYDLSAHSVKY